MYQADLQSPSRVVIRNETPADYRRVEEITRKAFYNLYVPGCSEHYLAHILRSHPDFVPQLDLVIELGGQVIGSIMYTRARLVDETGLEKPILTFGPLSVLPQYQRQGYGKRLLGHSFQKAAALGFDLIVIFGVPGNYVSRGFKSCRKYNVCLPNGAYPAAMLVKELCSGALDGRKWFYHDSPVMQLDERQARLFDEGLGPLEKKWQPSQEEFYILANSLLGPEA